VYQTPFAKAYAGEGTILMNLDGSLTYFYGRAGGNTGVGSVDFHGIGTTQRLINNQWFHVAIVRDFTNQKLTWYVNGVKNTEIATQLAAASASSLPIYLGKSGIIGTDVPVQNFEGQLDEVRIWNTARSEEQIKSARNTRLNGNETGLAGYWNFDASIPGKDLTVNNNNAVLVNGVTVSDSKINLLTGTAGQNVFVVGNKTGNLYTGNVVIRDFNPNLDTIQLYGNQDNYTKVFQGYDTLIYNSSINILIIGLDPNMIELSNEFTKGNIVFADPKKDDSETIKFAINKAGGVGNETLNYLDASKIDISSLNDAFPGQVGSFGALAGGGGDDSLVGSQTLSKTFDGVLVTYLDGGAGNDTLEGSNLNLDAQGRFVTDILLGWEGNDLLQGLQGRSSLDGGDGNDTLIGGSNSDTLNGGAGNDSINGGTGVDTVVYSNDTKAVTVDLKNATASAIQGDGSTDTYTFVQNISTVENVIGSNFNDSILGDKQNNELSGLFGNDTIDGGLGNDTLDGGAGNDLLLGGAGYDTLISGGGADTLRGGAGVDTYIVRSTPLTLQEAFNALGGNYKTRGKINGTDITWEKFILWADPSRWGGLVQWERFRELGLNPDQSLYQQAQTNDRQGWLRPSLGGTVITEENSAEGKPEEDTLIIAANAPLSKTGLQVGKIGLQQQVNDLIIDLNQDGIAEDAKDLKIENFFAGNEGGVGSISTIRVAGLEATYYQGVDFTKPITTVIDSNINFNWGSSAPIVLSSNFNNNFGVIWQGVLKIDSTGSYKFRFNKDSDDNPDPAHPKYRLFVNNTLVENDFTGINLSANQEYSLRLEYTENSGDAKAQLLWSVNGAEFSLIPDQQFLSPQTLSAADILNSNRGLTPVLQEKLDIKTKDWKSAATFGDYNNDGYLDFLVVGSDAYGSGVARIYKNVGDTSPTARTFVQVDELTQLERFESAIWGDYNNDGYLDILATGTNTVIDSNGAPIKQYQVKVLQNSNGEKFTDVFTRSYGSSPVQTNWADLDNNGKQDIVIAFDDKINIYYQDQQGQNVVPVVQNSSNPIVKNGKVNLGDLDNDGYIDIVLASKTSLTSILKLEAIALTKLKADSMKFNRFSPQDTDMGNKKYHYEDFKLDSFQSGNKPIVGQLYQVELKNAKFDTYLQVIDSNNKIVAYDDDGGEGTDSLLTFVYKDGYKIRATSYYALTPNDFPADGNGLNFDLLVTPINDSVKIVKNLGSSRGWSIYDQEELRIQGSETVTLGDYDQDGKTDLLITDQDRTRVYQNNDDFVFEEFKGKSFDGELTTSSSINDYRLATGTFYKKAYSLADFVTDSNRAESILIRLDAATFDAYLQVVNPTIKSDGTSGFQQLAFADDSDGTLNSNLQFDYTPDLKDAQVWVTTYNSGETGSYKLYSSGIGLPSITNGSASWGDYDNDGDLDVALSGLGADGSISKVFLNPVVGTTTNQNFTELPTLLPGLQNGSTSWGDYDNDGDLDLLVTGTLGTIATPFFQVYRNTTVDNASGSPNAAPPTPALATSPSQFNNGVVKLSWLNASVGEEPYTYNLRIGSKSGSSDILSPGANNIGAGKNIGHIGNVGFNTEKSLPNLAKGVSHFWSVQSVDNGFRTSDFSTENSFTTNPFVLSTGTAAGVKITPANGLVTSETGTVANFNVVLDRRPTKDVILTFNSSDTTEGQVLTQSLTFTPNNWNIAQSTSVQGIRDGIVDGNTTYRIQTTVKSQDLTYNRLPVNEITISNQDQDSNTTRITSQGIEFNSDSSGASFNGDGNYLVFASRATNTGLGGYGTRMILFYNRESKDLSRIDLSYEEESNGDSNSPSISADGRYVAFYSYATNLVGDTNGTADIFLYDLDLETTKLISANSSGIQANGASFDPIISANGRYIAFRSAATNLVAGDTNNVEDIFVHDRLTSTTKRVNVSNTNIQANGSSYYYSISGDGRYIVFQSNASNLVTGDNNDSSDVFVYDQNTSTTKRISIGNNNSDSNGASFDPSISDDGRYIVFISGAANLAAGDNNYLDDVFIYDQVAQTTSIITNNGVQPNGFSYAPKISADGRYITFASWANNLVPDDNNLNIDVFVYDRVTQTIKRVDVSNSNTQSNAVSEPATISGNGKYVAFISAATNLVSDDNNNTYDIFIRDIAPDVGITVTSLGKLVTSEAGRTANFSVVLNSKPTANVTVNLASSEPTEGTTDKTSLTFTPNNWNITQAVTINGVDDNKIDGDRPYSIITSTQSADSFYNNFNVSDVAVTNLDNDESALWTDFNNDGRLDTVILGNTTTSILTQQPAGSFTTLTIPNKANQVSIADYDSDGDFDLLLNNTGASILYQNTNGTFASTTPILPGANSSVWGDFDSDGDLDLLLANNTQTSFYKNNAGTLVVQADTLAGGNSIITGDYDNDGKLDVAILGTQLSLYHGKDNGFEKYINDINLNSANYNTITQADYDNDQDLDLLLSVNGGGAPQLLLNQAANPIATPASPSLIKINEGITAGSPVTLKWNSASDAQTPSEGLTYNLRIGTTPGGQEILSLPVNADGQPLPSQFGNVGQGKKESDGSHSWALKGLTPGQYYWSVQAVDNSLVGSAFAPEQTFAVMPTATFSTSTLSITEGGQSEKKVNLTVQLSQASTQEISIDYSIFSGATDTAVDADFKPFAGTIKFAPNTTTQTIELTIKAITCSNS
jgi:Concanavalin A-like lectin/glucanases superfamily/PA14 domain/FG-GAP-like repeat/RTX calcium-binding nonapeptide repeat (4 copies)/WD40-like Beta Propeller Repeat